MAAEGRAASSPQPWLCGRDAAALLARTEGEAKLLGPLPDSRRFRLRSGGASEARLARSVSARGSRRRAIAVVARRAAPLLSVAQRGRDRLVTAERSSATDRDIIDLARPLTA